MSDLSILEGYNTIQLTKGKNTLVDAQDWPRLRVANWATIWSGCHYYATSSVGERRLKGGKRCKVLIHRFIRGQLCGDDIDGKNVDHRNRDTLDNRRQNIRVATVGQNRSNSTKKLWRGGKSSEYKGVSWHKHKGKWRAIIVKDKLQRELGYFDSETDAAQAYNRAAIELHGEFARINEGV